MQVRAEEEGSSWRHWCFRCAENRRKEEEGGRSPPRAEPADHRPLECVHRRPPAMDHGLVRAQLGDVAALQPDTCPGPARPNPAQVRP
jgi:hypothetical protein